MPFTGSVISRWFIDDAMMVDGLTGGVLWPAVLAVISLLAGWQLSSDATSKLTARGVCHQGTRSRRSGSPARRSGSSWTTSATNGPDLPAALQFGLELS